VNKIKISRKDLIKEFEIFFIKDVSYH